MAIVSPFWRNTPALLRSGQYSRMVCDGEQYGVEVVSGVTDGT
jgi:hypothetical protein